MHNCSTRASKLHWQVVGGLFIPQSLYVPLHPHYGRSGAQQTVFAFQQRPSELLMAPLQSQAPQTLPPGKPPSGLGP